MDPLAHLPAPGRARVLVDGLDHPEGVAYDPEAGVVWAGGEDGQLYRVRGDGYEEVARAPGFVLGLAVDLRGRLAVCASTDGSLCAYDGEAVHRLVPGVGYPNWPAFTADGGALISCYRPDRIYHLDAAGHLEVVAQDPQGTLLGAPTNVCFVGARLDRVVCANLGRWHLTLLDLGMRGAPPHRPLRWALDAAAVRA